MQCYIVTSEKQTLRIKRDKENSSRIYYYIEYRRPIGIDQGLLTGSIPTPMDGVLINYIDEGARKPYSYLIEPKILPNPNPGVPIYLVPINGTFYDPDTGVSITPLGEQNGNMMVKVHFDNQLQPIPAEPSNLFGIGVSTSQIDLQWQDNSNNEDGFIVEKTDSTAPALIGWREVGRTGVNQTTYADQYLSPKKEYGYRVRAYNSSGESLPSNEIKVQTLPDITPPLISYVVSIDITVSSAMITWVTNELSDSQVEYGLTINYGEQTTVDMNNVVSHVVNLSGLSSGETYHYRVKSKDAAGNLSVSGDFTFTTLSVPLPDLTVSAIRLIADEKIAGNFVPEANIMNVGDDEAKNVSGIYFYEVTDMQGDTIIKQLCDERDLPGVLLPKDTSSPVTCSSQSFSSGTHYIKVVVDEPNYTVEKDDNNNSLVIAFVPPQMTVWPGDADNNGVVDQGDLLPIGLYYGKIGPARANASTAWVGQPVVPWSPAAAAYADTNGDGVVSDFDIYAIDLNWGKYVP